MLPFREVLELRRLVGGIAVESRTTIRQSGKGRVADNLLFGIWGVQRKIPVSKLEAFQHPDVGSSTGFPECKMLAVWCRDRPADRHLCIFEHRPGPPLQVDVQQRPCSGVGIRRRPQAAAVRGKIDTADSCPGMRSNHMLGTVRQRKERDARVLRRHQTTFPLAVARILPSGDRLQLYAYAGVSSILACGSSSHLPVLGSKRKNKSSLVPRTSKRHNVEGKRAHCTFPSPSCSKTVCDGPPESGTRITRPRTEASPSLGQI